MDEIEARVWQRVSRQTQAADLPTLVHRSREAAACLRQLAGMCGPETRRKMQQLYKTAAASANAMAGIAHMQGCTEQITASAWPESGFRRALAQAYRRSSRLWQDYTAQSHSGEYAQVYSTLSAREAQISTELLELLGMR